MLLVHFKINGVAKIGKRQINDIVRDALAELGHYWVDNMLPKHFSKAGARDYEYTPRKGEPGSERAFKGSYTARKLRQKKHTLPLVWSGEARTEIMQGARVNATVAGDRATVRIALNSRKLNWRHPNSKVRMNDEIKKVSAAEIPVLQQQLVSLIEAGLSGRGKGATLSEASINAFGS